jgi:ubiquinone/menaquinone biosynthesis C-methylase UbiE
MKTYSSEIEKYRHLVVHLCQGNGVDIGTQGYPVVPWAIQLEQPPEAFTKYCGGLKFPETINWKGDCFDLPFKDNVLDFVCASHLIEDFDQAKWPVLFSEWRRCLKPGGHMIVFVPERERWAAALARGQCPNCAHQPEPFVGDMTKAARRAGLKVLEERLTDLDPEDYSIMMIAQKVD